jgi:hypothetical protein
VLVPRNKLAGKKMRSKNGLHRGTCKKQTGKELAVTHNNLSVSPEPENAKAKIDAG